MNDTHETPVIFRAERSGNFKGDITAVFPCEPSEYLGPNMTCYAHIGQHSGCSHGWYNQTRAAKPDEYEALQKELSSIGYRVKVYRRLQPWMRSELRKQQEQP